MTTTKNHSAKYVSRQTNLASWVELIGKGKPWPESVAIHVILFLQQVQLAPA